MTLGNTDDDLRQGFDSIALLVTDTTGIIRYWSPRARALFGHENPIGTSLDTMVPEDLRERHWAGFRRAMRRASPRHPEVVSTFPCSAPM